MSELIVIEEQNALAAFSTDDGLEQIIAQVKAVVDGFEHDMSTKASRARTASLANKVSKMKVRLDGMGKDLVADWKSKSKAVDANRKAMRDELDALKIVARQPLTDWEDEQQAIEAAKKAEELQKEIDNCHEMALLLDAEFNRKREEIRKAEQEAERLRIAAEEKARLERDAEIARKAKEHAEREAKEREEKIRREAEEAKAKAERELMAAIEREKEAERQRIAAEERAKIEAEQAEIRRQQQAKMAEDRAKREAEAARQAEINRQREKEEREEKEKQAREANRLHVCAVRKAAKEALMRIGLTEAQAKYVVMAVHNGQVPAVIIHY